MRHKWQRKSEMEVPASVHTSKYYHKSAPTW